MATKKLHLIDTFQGGVNDAASPRKISKGQIANGTDVQYLQYGKIVPMGSSKNYEQSNPNFGILPITIYPGYGLHHFNIGYSMGGTTSTQLSAAVTTQGTDGTEAHATCMLLPAVFYGGTGSSLRQLNKDLSNHTITIKLQNSGGSDVETLAAITNHKDSGGGYQTGPGWWTGDYLGLYSSPYEPWDAPTLSELIASTTNTNSSTIEAVANDSGSVTFYALAVGTTYNTHTIDLQISNTGGTYLANNNHHDNAAQSFWGDIHHTYNGINTPWEGIYEQSDGEPHTAMAGGAGPTTHVVTITVDAVDPTYDTYAKIQIGCDESGNTTQQTVTVAISAGTALATATQAIRDAINADSSVIIGRVT